MRLRAPTLLLLLLLAGCAGSLPHPQDGAGAVAPEAAIERFLQLAAGKEYLEMGWVFGTEDGPVIERDPRGDVERRMYALASVLQNDGYVVGRGNPVPGRTGGAVAFQVALQRGGRSLDVPFVAVRGSGSRWFVESVDVEAVTNVK